MIGKGREQTGESKKSRERERGKRKTREKDVYIVNCIIALLSLLLLLLCYYLLPSQHSHRLFFRFLPFLSSPLLSSPLPFRASFHSFIIFMSEV